MIESIKNQIEKQVQNIGLSDEDLISIINTCNNYLNLKAIPVMAKELKCDYKGVLARVKSGKLKQVALFGCKFIADNE